MLYLRAIIYMTWRCYMYTPETMRGLSLEDLFLGPPRRVYFSVIIYKAYNKKSYETNITKTNIHNS